MGRWETYTISFRDSTTAAPPPRPVKKARSFVSGGRVAMASGQDARSEQRRWLYWGPRVLFSELESSDPRSGDLALLEPSGASSAFLRLQMTAAPVKVRWQHRRSRGLFGFKVTRDSTQVFITGLDGDLVLRARGLFGFRIRRADGTIIARRRMFRFQTLREVTEPERTICLITNHVIHQSDYLVWWTR